MDNPTLAGFILFIRNVMGISVTVLPDDSPSIQDSFDFSLEWVLCDLKIIAPRIYSQAVYNLAGDALLNYAQDVPGQTFFADTRAAYSINSFQAGVIQSSGDENTNESMVVQEAAKYFTLADLQQLKTPYGRYYLQIAQQYGTVWGIS
jgi:hypothetical protein